MYPARYITIEQNMLVSYWCKISVFKKYYLNLNPIKQYYMSLAYIENLVQKLSLTVE